MAHIYRDDAKPVLSQVMIEHEQSNENRRWIFEELRKKFDRPVVSFCTSFNQPIGIESSDAQMLEDVLKTLDLSKGLVLLINTPGGDGIAAEQIIRICREYSGTKEFWALVPGKAKSAGTMICMGASKIIMGPASELGPIDPQVIMQGDDDEDIAVSAYNFIRGYENLLKGVEKASKNRQLPYLQQLVKYDETTVETIRSMQKYSEDFAVKALGSGMMKGMNEAAIRDKIALFLEPSMTLTHSRPIYREEAANCGLVIEKLDSDKVKWNLAHELYLRTDFMLSKFCVKCIESETYNCTL